MAFRHVSGKGTVLVRADVEPFIIGLVVQEEVVSDALVRCVKQCAGHQVGVFQSDIDRLFNGVQANSQRVKELVGDQVVIGGVFVAGTRSIEHDVVPTGRQRHGNDTSLGVVLCMEVEGFTGRVDGLEAKGGRNGRTVVKGSVFSGVEVHMEFNFNGLWFDGDFNLRRLFIIGPVGHQILHCTGVQALVNHRHFPNAIGQSEGKFTDLIGFRGVRQAFGVGRRDHGWLPCR